MKEVKRLSQTLSAYGQLRIATPPNKTLTEACQSQTETTEEQTPQIIQPKTQRTLNLTRALSS